MMVSRAEVIAAARTWIGTPFHHQARQKGVGVDCVGLTIGVALELGLVDEDTVKTLPIDYKPHPDPKLMRQLLCDNMNAVWPPQPGDWIYISMPNNLPTHVALVTGKGSIIHADSHCKQVAEHPFPDSFLRIARGAFAYRGVSDDG
jgi:cell wall-associated NlpC family hydrolase